MQLSVGIETGGVLEAYNADFELLFRHQLKYIVGMCRFVSSCSDWVIIPTNVCVPSLPVRRRMTRKPEGGRNRAFEIDMVHAKGDFMEVHGLNNGLIYLIKDPRDPLLHIHLFECDALDEVRWLLICLFINKVVCWPKQN